MVKVTMTFDEANILDVIVDSSGETKEIGAAAANKLAEQLKNAQGSEIDGVTGATVTANAVKKAAAECIAQAMGLATEQEQTQNNNSDNNDWLGKEPEINSSDVYAEESADVLLWSI